jgi:hypothetical protein
MTFQRKVDIKHKKKDNTDTLREKRRTKLRKEDDLT